MKKIIKNLITVLVITFITLSFTTLNTEKKAIKTEDSKVTWKGYKVTGSHQGTIAIQSGSLTFFEEKLTSGEIIIDMKSIENTDMKDEYKRKLEGHLKSDDFFGVEKFPTATLVFNDVKSVGKNSYTVTGKLTIKGITNPIIFSLSVYGNKATANLKIDRTKFKVKYGSTSFFDNLRDKAIYDEFDLIADLKF